MSIEKNINALAAATVMQAVRDYLPATPQRKQIILRELRSPWMCWFSNGTSENIAEQLENNAEEIATRMKLHYREEN